MFYNVKKGTSKYTVKVQEKTKGGKETLPKDD